MNIRGIVVACLALCCGAWQSQAASTSAWQIVQINTNTGAMTPIAGTGTNNSIVTTNYTGELTWTNPANRMSGRVPISTNDYVPLWKVESMIDARAAHDLWAATNLSSFGGSNLYDTLPTGYVASTITNTITTGTNILGRWWYTIGDSNLLEGAYLFHLRASVTKGAATHVYAPGYNLYNAATGLIARADPSGDMFTGLQWAESHIDLVTNETHARICFEPFVFRTGAGANGTVETYFGAGTTHVETPGRLGSSGGGGGGGGTTYSAGDGLLLSGTTFSTNPAQVASPAQLSTATNDLYNTVTNFVTITNRSVGFAACMTGTVNNLSALSLVLMPFQTVHWDSHGRWNTSSYKYTFPVVSNWTVNATLTAYSTSGFLQLWIFHVSQNGTWTNTYYNNREGTAKTPHVSAKIMVTSTTDYIQVYGRTDNGAEDVQGILTGVFPQTATSYLSYVSAEWSP